MAWSPTAPTLITTSYTSSSRTRTEYVYHPTPYNYLGGRGFFGVTWKNMGWQDGTTNQYNIFCVREIDLQYLTQNNYAGLKSAISALITGRVSETNTVGLNYTANGAITNEVLNSNEIVTSGRAENSYPYNFVDGVIPDITERNRIIAQVYGYDYIMGSLTGLPIFDVDAIKNESAGMTSEERYNKYYGGDNPYTYIWNYILNGDDSGRINKDIGQIWNVYVDGTFNPIIKLTWRPKNENSDTDYSNFKVHIGVKAQPPTTNITDYKEVAVVDYSKGSYQTSFKELADAYDYTIWLEILSALYQGTIRYPLVMGYYISDGKTTSDLAYTVIYNTGEIGQQGGGGKDDTQNSGHGTGKDDEGYKDPSESSSTISPTDGYNGIGLFTTTYAMTSARLANLGTFLWGASFIDNIKLINNSPIENVVSCKMFPFDLSGSDAEIILGNVSTGVNGAKISGFTPRRTIGTLSIPRYYNSFLDYSPYTKLTVFLPFIGFKLLDTSKYMGRTLKLEYIFDLITGACKALISANGVVQDEYDGACGIDIPLNASNRAQVEAGYITSALGSVASIASGNVMTGVSGALSGAMAQFHTQTEGTYSPTCGAYETRTAYVIYDRPTYQEIDMFNHTRGKCCNLSLSIANLTGFTVCDRNIDTSGIPCTEEERQEIVSILSTGFFA